VINLFYHHNHQDLKRWFILAKYEEQLICRKFVTGLLSVLSAHVNLNQTLLIFKVQHVAVPLLWQLVADLCVTPFLLSLLSVHPVIHFQFLPPRGAVFCFLLWSSLLKGSHSPFGGAATTPFGS
jgi:hypothetical protein